MRSFAAVLCTLAVLQVALAAPTTIESRENSPVRRAAPQARPIVARLVPADDQESDDRHFTKPSNHKSLGPNDDCPPKDEWHAPHSQSHPTPPYDAAPPSHPASSTLDDDFPPEKGDQHVKPSPPSQSHSKPPYHPGPPTPPASSALDEDEDCSPENNNQHVKPFPPSQSYSQPPYHPAHPVPPASSTPDEDEDCSREKDDQHAKPSPPSQSHSKPPHHPAPPTWHPAPFSQNRHGELGPYATKPDDKYSGKQDDKHYGKHPDKHPYGHYNKHGDKYARPSEMFIPGKDCFYCKVKHEDKHWSETEKEWYKGTEYWMKGSKDAFKYDYTEEEDCDQEMSSYESWQ